MGNQDTKTKHVVKICPKCNTSYQQQATKCSDCKEDLKSGLECPWCSRAWPGSTLLCEDCGYNFSYNEIDTGWAEKKFLETEKNKSGDLPVYETPFQMAPDWIKRLIPFKKRIHILGLGWTSIFIFSLVFIFIHVLLVQRSQLAWLDMVIYFGILWGMIHATRAQMHKEAKRQIDNLKKHQEQKVAK